MQNEMIKVGTSSPSRGWRSSIHSASFVTLMVDETTDASNCEQVVLCIRWVDANFEVHEDFIGVFMVDAIDADTITAVIFDILRRLNLSIAKVRGQCYDGASTMSGKNAGVVATVLKEEPKALYTHCYGHSLSLLKSELAPDTPGIRVLCPTRWTVMADSLKSILDNFEVLQELWEESIDLVKDTEMKARINGVASQMKTFDYYFGICLGHLILKHSDNLSRALQMSDISASEGVRKWPP